MTQSEFIDLVLRVGPLRIEMLRLMAKGITGTRELADALDVNPITVKHHLTQAFKIAGVVDRPQLLLFAIRNGLVEVPVENQAVLNAVLNMESTFDLRWKADRRAVELWRAESPTERELTIPDHADLVVYLMKKVEMLLDALAQVAPVQVVPVLTEPPMVVSWRCPDCGYLFVGLSNGQQPVCANVSCHTPMVPISEEPFVGYEKRRTE